jgi:probable HAF family extracellular repeat protein
MRRAARPASYPLVATAVALFALSAPAAQPSFTPLPYLPGAPHTAYSAGISGDGRVVAGYNYSGSDRQAVRWVNGSPQGLGDLGGVQYSSTAFAASADGSVIVGGASASFNGTIGGQAFRWESGTMTGLGTLGASGPGSTPGSVARGVSGDGRVVVGSTTSPGAQAVQAFRWNNGVMQGLGDLPGGSFWSEAWGTNQDGSVVVGESMSGPDNATEPFRWTQATGMVGLGKFPGGIAQGAAYAVTPDGSTVVGFSYGTNGRRPFRWRNGVMEDLGEVAGGPIEGIAYDVSADGNTIVGAGNLVPGGGSPNTAWVWDPVNGMQNLHTLLTQRYGVNLDGWTLYTANGISDDGTTVAGYGKNAAGEVQAFVAVIPEPALPATAAVLLAGLLIRRRGAQR